MISIQLEFGMSPNATRLWGRRTEASGIDGELPTDNSVCAAYMDGCG